MRDEPGGRESLPREVGSTLAGWITGQLKICAILMLVYAVGFALSRLPWWPLLAFVCGALQLIPYAGAAIAAILAMSAAWLGSDWEWSVLGAVATFVAAQALEGFWLTPMILGRRLRLPPYAVFLAILIGGFAFGPLGVVFAAPALAIAAILYRRAGRRA